MSGLTPDEFARLHLGDWDHQGRSRARIRRERKGDPSWTDLGDGYFALHIQYGGNAVVVRVQGGDPPGAGDIAALREWLEFNWPQGE